MLSRQPLEKEHETLDYDPLAKLSICVEIKTTIKECMALYSCLHLSDQIMLRSGCIERTV